MIITGRQIKLLDEIMVMRFVVELYDDLKAEEIIQTNHHKETELDNIHKTILYCSKRFAIESMDALDEIVRLSYQYPELISAKKCHPDVHEILTWPDRSEERKLKLVKKYLQNATQIS